AFPDVAGKDLVIALMNTDGSGYRVVARTAVPNPPVWSPDGRHILFCDGDGLCLYDVQARKVRRLRDIAPIGYTWSADGGQIVCLMREGPEAIWLDARSGEILLSVSLPTEPLGMMPGMNLAPIPQTWGVAFIASDGNLYSVEAGRVYQITRTGDVRSLWVSDDGSHLRWVRSPKSAKRYLVVHEYDMASRAVSGEVHRFDVQPLSPQKGYQVLGADGVFSPDGQRLLIWAYFTRSGKPEEEPKLVAVGTANIEGQMILPILQVNRLVRVTKESPVPIASRWSPDGSHVALQIVGEKQILLWLGRADGTGGRVLRHIKTQ
ncbi:MAG: hypothetical protein WHX60_17095, partial [Armatimonadota bacterium]